MKNNQTIYTEYAVRLKGTQKYLPRPQRRDGRGGSHLEPVDFSLPPGQRLSPERRRYETDMQIRSYADRRYAENFLRSYCQGKFGAHRYADSEDYYDEIYQIKGSERNIEDFEIVELTIILPQI